MGSRAAARRDPSSTLEPGGPSALRESVSQFLATKFIVTVAMTGTGWPVDQCRCELPALEGINCRLREPRVGVAQDLDVLDAAFFVDAAFEHHRARDTLRGKVGGINRGG